MDMSDLPLNSPTFPVLKKSGSQTFGHVPMWDSSDPARNPAPLPLNPTPSSPVRNIPNIGTRSQSPTKTFNPVNNLHRRINSYQAPPPSSTNVRDLSSKLNTSTSGTPGSPTKKPTPLASVANRVGSFECLSSNFKDSAGQPTPQKQQSKSDLRREHEELSVPPPLFASSLRSTAEDIDRLTRELSAPRELSPPSETIQALSLPPAHSSRLASSAMITGDFQILTGQLTDLLSISNSLQREMQNLSRRSKDNATDLLSLKEATNSRDEDIRKSLKDLVSGLNVDGPTPPPRRLAITSGEADGGNNFSGALTRYQNFDQDRNFADAAENVLRASQEKANNISRNFQQSLEVQSLEKITREMATKENQRRVLDFLEELQTDIDSQGKSLKGSLDDVLRTIRAVSISGITSGAVVKYGDSANSEQDKSEEILDTLASIKASLEFRIKEVLGAISEAAAKQPLTSTAADTDGSDLTEVTSSIRDVLNGQTGMTEDIKRSVQSTVTSSEKTTMTKLDVISDQVNELFDALEEIPRQWEGMVAPVAPPGLSGDDLSNLAAKLEETVGSRQQATQMTLEAIRQEIERLNIPMLPGQPSDGNELATILHEISKLQVPQQQQAGLGQQELDIILAEIRKLTFTQDLVPKADTQQAANPGITKDEIAFIVNGSIAELKSALARVHGEVAGQEKVTEKALEIILREVTKISPAVQGKVAELDSRIRNTPAEISAHVCQELRQEIDPLRSSVGGVEKAIQKSLETIIHELQEIKEREVAQSKALIKSGSDHHCESSVAAVNAISAMGKDLKRTVENLQSDVNGREEVTEKAMEIILREIGSITKAVSGVPEKVVDRIMANGGFNEDLKAIVLDLQTSVVGREAHTEKAMESILREVATIGTAVDRIPISDPNAPVTLDRETKFTLETILNRSTRTADETASIQELLHTFHTSSTGTTQATYLLLQNIEKALKDPIIDTHDLLKDLQEKLGSTTKNTAESIVEVARLLSGLQETTAQTIEKANAVRGSVDAVDKNVTGVSESITALTATLSKKLEELEQGYKESSSQTLSAIAAKDDTEAKEKLSQQLLLIEELKTLTTSLKDGFSESVVTAHTEAKEVMSMLETNSSQQKENHAVLQGEVRTIAEALGGLKSEDGELAKVLAAVTDIALLLSNPPKKEEEEPEKYDDTEVRKMLESALEGIKSIEEAPAPEKYDDSDVKVKLESLLNHSNHQAKFFTQLGLIEEMQKQLDETSSKVDSFLESQKSLLETNAANERHAAAEAKLDLERSNSEKARVDQSVAALKAEESALASTVSNLRDENATLAAQKQHLATELSSLETALAIRREELALLENRAETLEKRFIEGVINQSRTLLMSKSKGDSAKPLKRINNPPETGSIRSKKPPTANGRRILSLSQISQPPSHTTGSMSRAPSIGSNMLLSTSSSTALSSAAGPAPLKRSQSVKTVAAEKNRRASWKAGGTIVGTLKEEMDKENTTPIEEEDCVSTDGSESRSKSSSPSCESTDLVKIDSAMSDLVTSLDAGIKALEDDTMDEEDDVTGAMVLVGNDGEVALRKTYPASLSAGSGGPRDSMDSLSDERRSLSGGFSDLGIDED